MKKARRFLAGALICTMGVSLFGCNASRETGKRQRKRIRLAQRTKRKAVNLRPPMVQRNLMM